MATNVDAVIQKLKTTLAEEPLLNLSADQIGDDVALMEGGLDLDSIGILDVIGLVETTFNFQFEDADLRMETFENLRSLAQVIARRIDG